MANWQQTYEQLKKRKKEVDNAGSKKEVNKINQKYEVKPNALNESYAPTNKLPLQLPSYTKAPSITTTKKKEEKRTWFSGGAFSDGYDFGDITKTILGTAGDIGINALKGVASAGEGLGNLIVGGVAEVSDWVGADDYSKKIKNRLAGKDEEYNKRKEKIFVSSNLNKVSDKLDSSSLIGEKLDDLSSSVGNLGGAAAGQSVGIPWYVTMGGSSAGHELENAYTKGATTGEAWGSAAITGASEVLIEKLFGGISFGGKTLDEGAKRFLSEAITNKTAQTLAKFGLDVVGEGSEEVLTEVVQNVGRKLTYEDEKTWKEILASEEALDNYLEAFIGGAVMGGGFNVGKLKNSLQTGQDYDSVEVNTQEIREEQQDVAPVQEQVNKQVQEQVQTPVQEIAPTQNVEDIDNQIAVLEEQLMATENEAEYQRLSNQIQELEQQANQIENQEIAPIKAASVEQVSQPTTQETNSNLPVEVESNTQNIENNATRETAYKYFGRENTTINETLDVLDAIKEKRSTQESSLDIIFDDSVGSNGVHQTIGNNRKIYVNPKSNNYLEQILIHEFAHDTENSKTYQELKKYIQEKATKDGTYESARTSLEEAYKKFYESKGLDFNKVDMDVETTNDILAKSIGNQEFLNTLATEKPSLLQKIYNWFKNVLFDGKNTGKTLKERSQLNKIESMFRQAMNEAYVKTKDGTKYAIENIAKFNQKEYNNANEITLPKSEYGRLAHIIDSDPNIAPGYNKVILADKTYDIYYKGYNEFKVIDAYDTVDYYSEVDSNGINRNANNSNSRNETTRSKQGYSQFSDAKVENRRTTNGNDGIFNVNTKQDSKQEYSDSKSNRNQKQELDNSSFFNEKFSVSDNLGKTTSKDLTKRINEIKNIREELRQQLIELKRERNDITETIPNYSMFKQYDELNDVNKRMDNNKNLSKELYAELQELETKIEEIKEQEKKERIAKEEAEATPHKLAQNRIIQKTNPMLDDYHTGIRSVGDIKTWQEAMAEAERLDEGYSWGDFSKEDAQKAVKRGKIRVYSSYAIKNGTFVSTSYQQALDYAGGERFKVHSREVALDSVAWISVDEGQYAKVYNTKMSLEGKEKWQEYLDTNWDLAPMSKKTNMSQHLIETTKEDIAPIKAELSDLTKDLKSTIKDTKKELKALKTELNEVKEEINDVVEEYKSMAVTELPGYQQQGVDSIRSIPDSEIDDMVAPVREETNYLQDEITIDDKYAKLVAKNTKDILGLNNKQGKGLEDVIKNNINSTEDQIYEELNNKYSELGIEHQLEDVKEIKRVLRGTRIKVSEQIKDDITDYAYLKQKNFGKIRFSNDGMQVDQVYEELSETYPDFFPSDISNPTDQLLKMIDVANESITLNDSLILPDETLQEAAELIYSGIQDYKETAHKKSYQEYEKMWASTLGDIAPLEVITEPITGETTQDNVIAPVQSLAIEQAPIEEIDNGEPMLKVSSEMETKTPQVKTDTETPTLEGNKNLSVKESNALKLKNLEISLKQYSYDAEQSLNSFNELIAEKKRQYNALKNKNTQKANNVLQQINRITAQRDNTQIEYERKMNNLEKRIDKMNSVDFKRAEQRMTKQEEYRKQANELIGDTSTWTDKKLGIQYQINTFKRNLRDIVKGVDGKADIQRADAIYNEYQGKYDTNEAALKEEFNRLAEPFRNRKLTRQEEVYTQMLGELKHNPGTTLKQDMVDSYYNKYKNKIDVDKVNQTIEDARKLYDELFERINDRLRRQGMKELEYRRGYFPHFTEEKQSMLAKLFDWKVKNDQIPTDIAGLTELNNPERSWQSFNKHREGDTTDYNFSKGFDTYVHGALDWIYHIEDIQKRRALENEIRYQHSEEGVKQKIEEIYNNPDLDADEVQTQIEAVYGVAKNPLNNFVTDLRNSTNNLAGKKSTLDRSLEYATNRQIYSTVTNLSNRVSGNMIGGSISSALTNFIPITQSWSQVSPVSSLKALGETIKSSVKDDGTIAKSTFLTNRLVKAENLYKSNWDKAADKVAIMTDTIDSITSQVVWRAKYNENIKAGMSEFEAIKDADQFAEGVIAGRSRGNEPTLFNSKNPITKMFTAFQLEVNNQYHYMFKDMPTDIGSKSKAKLIKGYATMFIGAYAYNALYSSLVGRDVAFDPIGLIEGILKELGIGGDDEEEDEKTASEKFTAITEKLIQQVPFVGGLFGGGRVPISAAIPYENPIEMVKGTATDLLDALDEEKREKALKNLTSEWLKPVTYLVLPFGGGQINKTYQGLSMYDDELPIAGSYTNSGDLRFTADESTWGKVQAGLFGKWASESAQEYVDSGFKTVKKSNIDEMLDLDMTSTEYRKYRNGLSKAKKKAKDNDSLTTTQAVADYIDGLDVSESQKAIMLENYFKSNLDEESEKELDALNMTADAKFSYFTAKSKIGTLENDYKNNIEKLKKRYDEDSDEYEEKAGILAREKQEKVINEVLNASLNDDEKKYLYSKYYSSEKVLNEITDTGTSMDTYLNFVKDTMYFTADLDDEGKTISGSLNNKYETYLLESDLSDEEKTALYEYGVLSGYDDEDKYKDYKILKSAGVDINSWLDFDSQEFEADYRSNGKVISGSKKNKVISYVNSLDLSIPQKAMMIRTKYTSFDNYNNDIVDYVVDLNIDYEEKVFMIETLGMKVSEDGTVRW